MDSIIKQIQAFENRPFYELMDLLLNELHIHAEEDIHNLPIDDRKFIADEVLNDDARILLCAAQKSACRQTFDAHKNKKQFFLHKSLWYNEDTSYLSAYSMLFPNRLVLHTSDVYFNSTIGIEETRAKIGYALKAGTDLLTQYIRHRDAIQNGDLLLFPQSVFQKKQNSSQVQVPSCVRFKNKCFLDLCTQNISIIPKTKHTDLVLELPWLMNADIRDFIELREKYKIEYDQFLLKIDELMRKAQKGHTLEALIAKEYNEASLEIKHILLQQKKELQAKGREIALGTFCTVVPIVLQEAGVELFDPKVMASVIGGTTVFRSILDYWKCRNKDRNNPFWILYKWEESQQEKPLF